MIFYNGTEYHVLKSYDRQNQTKLLFFTYLSQFINKSQFYFYFLAITFWNDFCLPSGNSAIDSFKVESQLIVGKSSAVHNKNPVNFQRLVVIKADLIHTVVSQIYENKFTHRLFNNLIPLYWELLTLEWLHSFLPIKQLTQLVQGDLHWAGDKLVQYL